MSRNHTLLALTFIGSILSAVLLYQYLTPGPMYCPGGSSACDLVKNSPFAALFDIPLPFWGLFYFATTALTLILLENMHKPMIQDMVSRFLSVARVKSAAPPTLAFQITTLLELLLTALIIFGFFFETYYTYLQFIVLEAICSWCLMIQITLFAMLIVLVKGSTRVQP